MSEIPSGADGPEGSRIPRCDAWRLRRGIFSDRILGQRLSESLRIAVSSFLASEDDGARTRNLRRDRPVLEPIELHPQVLCGNELRRFRPSQVFHVLPSLLTKSSQYC